MLEQRIQQQFFDSADLKYQSAEVLARPLAEAASALYGAITGGGKIMVAGTGPAASLARLMATRLVSGFERERPPLAALAVPEGEVPARHVQALGHPGDALLVFEGGDVAAARAAVEAAHDKEMTVVLLSAGPLLRDELAETDVPIAIPHERMARVLELQLLALHCLCDAIDHQLMGELDP